MLPQQAPPAGAGLPPPAAPHAGKPPRRGRSPGTAVLRTVALAAGLFAVAVLLRRPLSTGLPTSLFLPLHTLLEFVSALVGFTIFAVHWYAASAKGLRDARALFVSTAFVAAAAVDLLHALSYAGMPGAVSADAADRSILFWFIARVTVVTALVTAAFIRPESQARLFRRGPLFLGASLVVLGAIALEGFVVPLGGLFFREDSGLTPLKIGLETALALVFLGGALLHGWQYRWSRDRTSALFAGALALGFFTEVSLSLYVHLTDLMNVLGHVFKVAGAWMIFDALFVGAVLRPYAHLDRTLRELERSHGELAALRHHVENELAETIARLEDTTRREQEARGRAERAVERLAALQSVTDAALAHGRLDALLTELLERICRLAQADVAAVLLVSQDGATLEPHAWRGLEPRAVARLKLAFGEGLAGRVAATGSPLTVEDQADTGFATALAHEGVRSLAGVPLHSGDRTVGVIEIGARRARAWSEDDLRLLGVLADRVATAVERARLVAELAAAVRAVPEALLILSPGGRVLRANDAAERLLGDRDPAAGLAALRLDTPDGRPLADEDLPWRRALQGDVVRGEMVVDRSRDKPLWLNVGAAPIRTEDERVLGVVLSLTDVTALHELEEHREDLMRMVSHDLRTPLSAIHLQGQRLRRLLQRGEEPATVLPGLDAIVRSSERMSAMISDLVESERLSAGRPALDLQPVDLPGLVDEMLRAGGSLDPGRIQVRSAEGLPPVQADPARLERVLTNLLTNALKYSPEDRPVRLELAPRADAVRVAVIDQGEGIPPEDQRRIFDRYYRAPGVVRSEGLGLGLYITRLLVEAHGGRIEVESAPGRGSTFWFTLPRAA